MRAVVVDKPGTPDVLKIKNVPIPQVKEGWSLIKVLGFGVNHSEIFTRQGLSPSVKFPRILGIECVGVVKESTDKDKLKKGQLIISIMGEMGRAYDGSYAEYVLLPNDQIYPVSTNLSIESLVTLPETYYTAYTAYKSLQIKENDVILVRGATSGVGVSFLKLLKAKYPKVIVYGSTRSASKKDELINLGFTDVVLEKNGVLQTGNCFDKVIELIGPATIKDTFSHVNEFGIVCSCGQLGGKWYLEEFDPIIELQRNRYLTTAYSGDVSAERIQEMLDYVERYDVQAEPNAVYSLEQISEVHRKIESKDSFGKNIVII